MKQVKNKLIRWLPVISTLIIPGSGYVLLGKPARAMQMLFFMCFLGFVTFMLTGPDISPVGRFAGGFGVWALSVIEVHQAMQLRNQNS